MFGDTSGRPRIRVCCGPRCGVVPGHRAIYEAVESAAAEALDTLPTMCQGLCGLGVTLVLPGGEKCKATDTREAAEMTKAAAKRATISTPANGAQS